MHTVHLPFRTLLCYSEIKSFIAKAHSGGIPQEKVVEHVNQLYDISKEQSIPIQVPSYIK